MGFSAYFTAKGHMHGENSMPMDRAVYVALMAHGSVWC